MEFKTDCCKGESTVSWWKVGSRYGEVSECKGIEMDLVKILQNLCKSPIPKRVKMREYRGGKILMSAVK